MNKSQSKIRAIQNSNLVLENRYFNSKVILSEQAATNKEYLGIQNPGDPFDYLKVVDASGVETYYFKCVRQGCKKSYPNWTKAVGDIADTRSAAGAIKQKIKFKDTPETTQQLQKSPVSPVSPGAGTDKGTGVSPEVGAGTDKGTGVSPEAGVPAEKFVEPEFPKAKGD